MDPLGENPQKLNSNGPLGENPQIISSSIPLSENPQKNFISNGPTGDNPQKCQVPQKNLDENPQNITKCNMFYLYGSPIYEIQNI
jgi:hypothetical protein